MQEEAQSGGRRRLSHRKLSKLPCTTVAPAEPDGRGKEMGEEALSAAPPRLLSDDEVRHFIANGFVRVRVPPEEVPAATLSAVHRRTERLWAEANDCGLPESNPDFFGSGKFAFPRVAELGEVLASPTLRGAVASLLGPDFVQHPHRSMHVRSATGQEFHRDGNHPPMRHHAPRYLIGFFYPGPVTQSEGPSALLPGSQYLHLDGLHQRLHPTPHASSGGITPAAVEESTAQLDGGLAEYRCLCQPGTLLLMHYDVFHRGCAQGDDPQWRGMFKLNFFRSSSPTGPSWRHSAGAEYAEPEGIDAHSAGLSERLAPVHGAVWRWMLGEPGGAQPTAGPAELERLARLVEESDSEAERMGAAYALGADTAGAAALGALLRSERECVSRAAMYGAGAAGDAAVVELLPILAPGSGFGACHRIHALHAISDATHTPSALPDVCEALIQALGTAEADARDFIAAGSGSELDFVAGTVKRVEGTAAGVAKCRLISACVRAIGCVGERCVSAQPGGTLAPRLALAARLCAAVTPFTERQWLRTPPALHVDDGWVHQPWKDGRGDRPADQADDVNVHWCQEAAATALVQLCSGGSQPASHRPHPHTPAHHRDPRIAPALCLLAADRAGATGGTGGGGSGLREVVGGSVAEWREVMREATQAAAVEPWLAGAAEQAQVAAGLFSWFRTAGGSAGEVMPRL